MTVRERLIEYLRYKKIGQKAFAQSLGLSWGYVNAIRKSIPPDTLEKITAKYTDLNKSWLLLGEGKMLKERELSEMVEQTDLYKNKYISLLEEHNKLLAEVLSVKDRVSSLEKVVMRLEHSTMEPFRQLDELRSENKYLKEEVARLKKEWSPDTTAVLST
jgi:chromosome segregation ATPase